jgi:hypothetical protein
MAIIYDKTLEEGFKYISEDQRSEKVPFYVVIKPIDSVRLVTLEDGLLKRDADNSLSLSTGSYNVSLCKNAIVGWGGLQDAKGKDLEIQLDPRGYISNESLSKIPTMYINDIANVIASVSQDSANIQIFKAE